MSNLTRSLHGLVAELKRRSVFKVGVSYGVVGWLLVQVATSTFPYIGLPDWAVTLVIALVALGFPVAVLLAWAYDITPEGVIRDPADPAGPERPAPTDPAPAPEASSPPVPPAGGPARDGRIHNLPVDPTPFVGRERERRDLAALLRAPGARLVTITGPGGAGKTRLALQVAADTAQDYRDGVCFVPLAALHTPDLIGTVLAERLGLRLAGAADPLRHVQAFLRDRSLLLVLDNFDSLTEGAAVLGGLLEEAPALQILVSSRERLRLHAETNYPLEGLDLPQTDDPGALTGSDAVRLFLQSARRVDPGFAPSAEELREIGRICGLVAGLPLAIELAAAWVGVLSCGDIFRQIRENHDFLVASSRDAPERHRSLRAVFESSWRLLPDAEKEAFSRTAVFRDGFSRAAAEEVAGATLSTLMGLLNRSLLKRSGPERFRALELVRQYAAEKLRERADDERRTRSRHGRFFAEFLEARRERLRGPQEKEALEEVAVEIENIRGAWEWASGAGDLQAIDRMIEGLHLFHASKGRSLEGMEMFRAAVEAVRPRVVPGRLDGPAATLARLNVRFGIFCIHLGRLEDGRAALERGLELSRARGDDAESAMALNALGNAAFQAGDYEEAKKLNLEALAIAEGIAAPDQAGRALLQLGNTAYALGRYPEARRLFQDGLAIFRELGDVTTQSVALCNLGIIAGTDAAHGEAIRLLEESLTMAKEVGDDRMIAHSLHNLGCTLQQAGDVEAAERHFREGAAIARRLGYDRILAFCLNELGTVAFHRGDTAQARENHTAALTTARRTGETPMVLESLIGIARLLAAEGDREAAVELLSLVVQHPATDQRARERARTARDSAATGLPPQAAEAALRRGEALDLDGSVARIAAGTPLTLPSQP